MDPPPPVIPGSEKPEALVTLFEPGFFMTYVWGGGDPATHILFDLDNNNRIILCLTLIL